MALKKQFNDKFGNSHSDAYYRVTSISIDFENNIAVAIVDVYKDQSSRESRMKPIETYTYKFTSGTYNSIFTTTELDNKNPLKGVYNEIKTYPELSGSIDV